MFDVLDDLEDAVGKLLASEPCGDDLERVSKLVERMEFARLRVVGAFDRSGVWAADSFFSAASAMRSKLLARVRTALGPPRAQVGAADGDRGGVQHR